MVGELVPIALFVAVAYAIVGVTRIISEGRIRRRLVESGASPELVAALAAAPRLDPGLYGSLKWGLVIGAVGVALIIIQFLPYRENDPITFGLLLVFGAAGLLAYYAIARRLVATGAAQAAAVR